MAFRQFRLDRTSHQTRDISDQFIYRTDDTIEEVTSPQYFAQSRFAPGWVDGIVRATCGDGFIVAGIAEDHVYIISNSNVPYQSPTVTISGNSPWAGANVIYIDTSIDAVTIDLPPAAELPDEEIFFKVIAGSNVAIIDAGGNTFNTESIFTKFVMSLKNDYVKIKSDGVGSWYIIDRGTECGAAIALSAPTSFGVTTMPQVLTVFDTVLVSTALRCEANGNVLDILSIEKDAGDFYDVRFSGSFQYSNNSNLNLQVYCDGVAVPTLAASTQGQGPNNNASFGMSQMLLLSSACTLDLRIWGDTATQSIIEGLSFDAQRIGG